MLYLTHLTYPTYSNSRVTTKKTGFLYRIITSRHVHLYTLDDRIRVLDWRGRERERESGGIKEVTEGKKQGA